MFRSLSRAGMASDGRSKGRGRAAPRGWSTAATVVVGALVALTLFAVGPGTPRASAAPRSPTFTFYGGNTDSMGLTTGPDGALWFTNNGLIDNGDNSIGRITTSGVVSRYTGPGRMVPGIITAGPDGALWFTNYGDNSIGRVTTPGP